MCGIWAIFGADEVELPFCFEACRKIHHRGPDGWRIENNRQFRNSCLGFHRLAIVDYNSGMQPMKLKCHPDIWLICNGEIYNCQRLQKEFGFKYETKCDVEVIIHLYVRGGIEFCASHLDGVFSFCLVDVKQRKVFLARDTFGVRPAFQIMTDDGALAVCSEAKGVATLPKWSKCKVQPFIPGHYQEFDMLMLDKVRFIQKKPFHSIGNTPAYELAVPQKELELNDIYGNIRKLLTAAVKKRFMCHRRIGCLLSGGLDSSLIAALALKTAKALELPYAIQTFSIGMEESPDVLAARKVAAHIGSEHHEVIFKPDEALHVIEDVIYHLECYDITTIRASIGMYLVSQYISTKTDTVVAFSGEGADELAQGYIYFRDAPNELEGDIESRRLLQDLYWFDVLRADRTTAAHGLELRVPFLDHQFTSYYLSLPAELRKPKGTVEKHLLRSAFQDTGLLPDEILWRHKEAFSDGVTSKKKSLFEYIQEHVESKVSDEELESASKTYPFNTPKTKESLYYRKVFEKLYPNNAHLTPYFWMPRWTNVTDPSARYIAHYNAEA